MTEGHKVLVYTDTKEEDILQYKSEVKLAKDYKDMQKFVEGYIERLALPLIVDGQEYDVFLNEEGKFIEGLRPSIIISRNGKIADIVMGNYFISKSNKMGETVSLSDEEITKITKYIQDNTVVASVRDIGMANLLSLEI